MSLNETVTQLTQTMQPIIALIPVIAGAGIVMWILQRVMGIGDYPTYNEHSPYKRRITFCDHCHIDSYLSYSSKFDVFKKDACYWCGAPLETKIIEEKTNE